jgi:hypothetical protein
LSFLIRFAAAEAISECPTIRPIVDLWVAAWNRFDVRTESSKYCLRRGKCCSPAVLATVKAEGAKLQRRRCVVYAAEKRRWGMGRAIVLVLVLVGMNLWLGRFAANRQAGFVGATAEAHLDRLLSELKDSDEKALSDALLALAGPRSSGFDADFKTASDSYARFLLGADEAALFVPEHEHEKTDEPELFRAPEHVGPKIDRFLLMWSSPERDLGDARAFENSLGTWDSRLEKATNSYSGLKSWNRAEFIAKHSNARNCVASIPRLLDARARFVRSFYRYWEYTLMPPPEGNVKKAGQDLKRTAEEYDSAVSHFVETSGCNLKTSQPELSFGPRTAHLRPLVPEGYCLSSGPGRPGVDTWSRNGIRPLTVTPCEEVFPPDQIRQLVRDVRAVVDRCSERFARLSTERLVGSPPGPDARAHGEEALNRPWRAFARLTDAVCKSEPE